jgi:hypothetical protein
MAHRTDGVYRQMTWHFQVMRHKETFDIGEPEEWYAVHEYFVMEGDERGWTQGPVDVSGMNPEEIEWQLTKMLGDVQSRGVRCYDTGELL